MILQGIKWIIGIRDAPWSIINMSATLGPHYFPLVFSPVLLVKAEKPFAIDMISVRTIQSETSLALPSKAVIAL